MTKVDTPPTQTEQDHEDAKRLAGQAWHLLSSKDVQQAIRLQHVNKLLGPPADNVVGRYIGLDIGY